MLRQGELLLSASATTVRCGTFSGVYELNVRRVGDGDCVKCGAASVVETSERIHTALGIPLLRRVYESSTCTACNWWHGRAIKRPDYPRTPGARALVWLSWLLVLGATSAWIPHHLERVRTVDGYVAAPRAGDIWEIDLGAWPDTYNAGYTRALVGVVTEDEVAISLCEHTYTKSDDTDNCERFPVEHAPLSLAQIRALYETDAIDTIHRDGDVEVALEYGGIWFLAVLGLFVVHARRTRRVLGGAP